MSYIFFIRPMVCKKGRVNGTIHTWKSSKTKFENARNFSVNFNQYNKLDRSLPHESEVLKYLRETEQGGGHWGAPSHHGGAQSLPRNNKNFSKYCFFNPWNSLLSPDPQPFYALSWWKLTSKFRYLYAIIQLYIFISSF